MKMSVSMNIDYNTFTFLQDEEQLDITQGAMYKCKLFNKVCQPIKLNV